MAGHSGRVSQLGHDGGVIAKCASDRFEMTQRRSGRTAQPVPVRQSAPEPALLGPVLGSGLPAPEAGRLAELLGRLLPG